MAWREQDILTFAKFLLISSSNQYHCIIKTLNPHQTKLIIEICFSILYNTSLNLKQTDINPLKQYRDFYKNLLDKKLSLNFKRTILIPRNPSALRKALEIIVKVIR